MDNQDMAIKATIMIHTKEEVNISQVTISMVKVKVMPTVINKIQEVDVEIVVLAWELCAVFVA